MIKKVIQSVILLAMFVSLSVPSLQAGPIACTRKCNKEYSECENKAWSDYFRCLRRGGEEFQCNFWKRQKLSECSSEWRWCVADCWIPWPFS